MKLRKSFTFVSTEAEASAMVDGFNRTHSTWKNHRAVYTPWEGRDGERKFVVWYWTAR